jgi:hypothetical protein
MATIADRTPAPSPAELALAAIRPEMEAKLRDAERFCAQQLARPEIAEAMRLVQARFAPPVQATHREERHAPLDRAATITTSEPTTPPLPARHPHIEDIDEVQAAIRAVHQPGAHRVDQDAVAVHMGLSVASVRRRVPPGMTWKAFVAGTLAEPRR